MTEERLEYLSAGTLLLACLLIGFPMLFYGDEVLAAPTWAWWGCYAGFIGTVLALFASEGRVFGTSRWVPRGLIALLVAMGGAVVLFAPGAGWTPILLVISTALTAQLVGSRAAFLVLAINTALIAASSEDSLADAVFGGLLYATLQALTVWAVVSNLRANEARRELAAANVQLRSATALLAESSRSTERLRIARELHDQVGHQLTALSLELEVATHRCDPAAREHVQRGRDLAKELLDDVRGVVGELRHRPPELRAALEDLVAPLPLPRVHVEVPDDLSPDEDRVVALIRCAQEVVTNAIRHAEAENVWIEIRVADGSIVFEARDDGRGAPLLRLGNGLTGLRERVEALGGQVRFEARDGFRVWARMPEEAPP